MHFQYCEPRRSSLEPNQSTTGMSKNQIGKLKERNYFQYLLKNSTASKQNKNSSPGPKTTTPDTPTLKPTTRPAWAIPKPALKKPNPVPTCPGQPSKLAPNKPTPVIPLHEQSSTAEQSIHPTTFAGRVVRKAIEAGMRDKSAETAKVKNQLEKSRKLNEELLDCLFHRTVKNKKCTYKDGKPHGKLYREFKLKALAGLRAPAL